MMECDDLMYIPTALLFWSAIICWRSYFSTLEGRANSLDRLKEGKG